VGDFSHLSQENEARMVHLGRKPDTERSALVKAHVKVSTDCAQKLSPEMALEIARTARLSGIQAAKQTAMLIPLCHQVPLKGVDVTITFDQNAGVFEIKASAHTFGATGVEMEAMCAASMAAVTVYDMVKGADPEAVIHNIFLAEKKGGKKGHWLRSTQSPA
jgi:cyclic pyranopterin phosphate synthase